jgi:cyanophycinase-like exopeptidase
MTELETSLIDGRPPRFVQLPTAAGQEGPASIGRWVALGEEQAQRIGVEPVPVLALDRPSAQDPSLAERVAGAGLIYLSGGSPRYLAETLADTKVWAAIHREWTNGAALAGCSAGAIALTNWVPDIRRPEADAIPGLAVVPHLRVLPHFDRLRSWRPQSAEEAARYLPEGMKLVGIDEDTAIVSEDLNRWRVYGRQSAWVFDQSGHSAYSAGEEFLVQE